MEEKGRKKRIEGIIDDLRSRNERKIIGALKRIPHEGSPEMIEPLFELMARQPGREVRMLLEKILHNIKDTESIAPMLTLLRSEQHEHLHQHILNAIWQSGLDVREELDLLIALAATGNYLKAFEVLTIVENLEFDDDNSLTRGIKRMDEVVGKKGDTQEVLISLRQILLEKLLGDQ